MTLAQIAVNNLLRRKLKMALVLAGLVVGIATAVAIYSIVETMKAEMAGQMAAYGANIVITADTGEIAFAYGGINIPEVLFDVEQLTMSDVSAIHSSLSGSMVRAVLPRLLGMLQVKGQVIVIAGSDRQSDFQVKPWLRIRNMLAPENSGAETRSSSGMAAAKLDLNREDFTNLNLESSEVILGSGVSYALNLYPGDTISLDGHDFRIAAILQKNGSSEDNQVLMDLTAAQELLGRPDEVSVIELSADYNAGSEDSLLEQLNLILPQAKITSLRKVLLDRNELVAQLTRFGTAITILVLLTGFLTATLTLSGSIRERTREIGIFRAIGFRRAHIIRILLLENLLISTLGGLLGYLAGTAIARLAGPLLANAVLLVPWRLDMLLLAVPLALAIGCLASLYPVWQAARLDPSDALRYL